jgi:hypothetical protein
MAIIARIIRIPRFGGVIAYQPWLNGEREAFSAKDAATNADVTTREGG